MSVPVYLALLHHPVRDKHGKVVTTAITNLDLHDLGRLACAYEVARVFIVNPVPAQGALFERLASHWREGWGAGYNETRRLAFERLAYAPDLESAADAIERIEGARPVTVITSARGEGRPAATFAEVRRLLEAGTRPALLLFGTGWGLTEEAIRKADVLLEPVVGRGAYRHLSVRSAASIVLDRLLAPTR